MKSLIRFCTTTVLVATTIVGSSLLGNVRAIALPTDKILEKLQFIPVFTITDAQGAPLVASVSEGQKKSAVTGVFISQKDAQAFLDRLKKQQPKLGENVKIVPIPLAEIYKLQQSNQSKTDGLNFAYVPNQQQADSALGLMRQSDPKVQQFPGVPLFAAKAGQDKGYLTIQQNNQQVIPFFFDKEQLQNMIDRFKQQQPKMAGEVQIQAVSLEGMLQILQKGNDQQLNNIVIVPSREALDFLRSLQGNSGQPQLAPAKKNK
jgi:Tic22-like family